MKDKTYEAEQFNLLVDLYECTLLFLNRLCLKLSGGRASEMGYRWILAIEKLSILVRGQNSQPKWTIASKKLKKLIIG